MVEILNHFMSKKVPKRTIYNTIERSKNGITAKINLEVDE